MATQVIDPSPSLRPIGSPKLWFGFTAATAAWVLLGLLDLLIVWRACVGGEQSSDPHSNTATIVEFAIVTFALLGLSIASGVISYGNWKRLCGNRERLADAEGRSREEFMALAGVYLSFTMSIGIVWLGLPVAMLQLCVRTR